MAQQKKRRRTFGRESAHRQAILRSIASELVEHERIRTTIAKGKEVRRFIEPLITRSKEDTLANRRLVFNRLRNRNVVAKLFNDIGPRCKARPGGYLRILKCGYRLNDNAPMAIIELVDRQGETTDIKKPDTSFINE